MKYTINAETDFYENQGSNYFLTGKLTSDDKVTLDEPVTQVIEGLYKQKFLCYRVSFVLEEVSDDGMSHYHIVGHDGPIVGLIPVGTLRLPQEDMENKEDKNESEY